MMSIYYNLVITRLASKLMFRRLGVRFPTGHFYLNKKSTFEPPCHITSCIESKAEIHVGAFTGTQGTYTEGILTNVSIGRYCSIAKHAKLWLAQHPTTWLSSSSRQYFEDALLWHVYTHKKVKCLNRFSDAPPTKIGNDVWIGDGAVFMGGVSVGDGAVIAANAVVTHNVPPYAIVGGVPARIIKYRFDEDTIKELLELKWWQYDIADFGDVNWSDVKEAVKGIKQKIAARPAPAIYSPKQITGKEMYAYSSRCLFFFEFSKEALRVKLFGLWIVHIVFNVQ